LLTYCDLMFCLCATWHHCIFAGACTVFYWWKLCGRQIKRDSLLFSSFNVIHGALFRVGFVWSTTPCYFNVNMHKKYVSSQVHMYGFCLWIHNMSSKRSPQRISAHKNKW